jgi:hypothetical protein
MSIDLEPFIDEVDPSLAILGDLPEDFINQILLDLIVPELYASGVIQTAIARPDVLLCRRANDLLAVVHALEKVAFLVNSPSLGDLCGCEEFPTSALRANVFHMFCPPFF